MFVQIIHYHFKDEASFQAGVSFIQDHLVPHHAKKTGYISSDFFQGGPFDAVLIKRFKVKENLAGPALKTANYDEFKELWRRPAVLLSGTNQAQSKFSRSGETV